MTTTAHTPMPLLPTDPQPIAILATTRPAPVREMTALLTRLYGPGLIINTNGTRTTWAKPTTRRKANR